MNVSMVRFGNLIALAVIVLDQASKWVILEIVMDPPRIIPVLPFFDIVLVWNKGVSFGLLGSFPQLRWVLTGFAIVVVIFMILWMRRTESRLLVAGLGLIVGGAVGNVIDRIVHGAVVDFIDIFVGNYHWPAFNVADSAITLGVVALLIDSLIGKGGDRKIPPPGQVGNE